MKILVNAGWGYSMTLNSFYQVVRETPKGAVVRRIGRKVLDGDGWTGHEIPVADSFDGEQEYRVQKYDGKFGGIYSYKGKVDMSRTQYLEEWDGEKSYYFNNLD